MINKRVFKVLALTAVLIMLFTSSVFAVEAFRGGGWLPNGEMIPVEPIDIISDIEEEPTGKASFGFTAKVVDEDIDEDGNIIKLTKGEFQYNDKVVGLKFHGDVLEIEQHDDNWVMLHGEYMDDGMYYRFVFEGVIEDEGLLIEINVYDENDVHYYYNEDYLGGGTFNFWDME